MTFVGLIWHNVGVKKVRAALTTLAVAVGVAAVVTLGLVNQSLRDSELALMQVGRSDFTVAQKGVSDIINSSIDQVNVARMAADSAVTQAIGVLLATTRLSASNPQFLEIGVQRSALAPFGVTVVSGQPFAANATDQILLGWRAAQDLGKKTGGTLVLGGNTYRIVGLYSTGNSLGDEGAMMPLQTLQILRRQSGQVSLLFVQLRAGTNVAAVRTRIEADFPQLTTIRTTSDFGRADRSLALLNAAYSGSRVLAIGIGALIVMSMMTMAFIERIREFGVLRAVGWSSPRVLVMVLGEALLLGVIGAAGGVALSVLATRGVQALPALRGLLSVTYTAGTFGSALFTAAGMTLVGAAYPALRAALLQPLEALRHE